MDGRTRRRRRADWNQASFDPRNYGYRKLSDLIEATGLFEVKRQDLIVFVRAHGDARQLATRLSLGIRARAAEFQG